MLHGASLAIQILGLAVVIVGGLRIVRAPRLAARRAARVAGVASSDSGRYARGLTDFYRISGGIAVVAGVLLILVPLFAG